MVDRMRIADESPGFKLTKFQAYTDGGQWNYVLGCQQSPYRSKVRQGLPTDGRQKVPQ